jgi:hypothetical protein
LGKSKSKEEKAFEQMHWSLHSPGYLLQQASLDFIWAGVCGIAACGVGGGASFVHDSEIRKALFISSVTLGVASMYLGFKGVVNIGRAGKVMDDGNYRPVAQLRPSTEGLGVKLTF